MNYERNYTCDISRVKNEHIFEISYEALSALFVSDEFTKICMEYPKT